MQATTIQINEVASVYSGRPGCACGCRGKHTYASEHREASSKRRGYEIGDDEVNDKIVARHLKTINAALERGEATDEGGHIFYDAGGRWYIAYLAN